MPGLSRQVVSHDSGLSRQVSLYIVLLNIVFPKKQNVKNSFLSIPEFSENPPWAAIRKMGVS